MPIFAAVLGHVLTNKRLTAALLASLAQLARARDGFRLRWFESITTHFSRSICGNSSVDRALAFQAGGRGFESRFPLTLL